MELDQIVKESDFIRFLNEQANTVAESHTGSLEEYLRSVLAVAIWHNNEQCTFRLVAQILSDAFMAEPAPFDPAWMAYTSPPPFISDPQEQPDERIETAIDMLRYQIADLRRLQDNGQLTDPYRYYGIQSPTGHSWYNFNPAAFLECASHGLGDGPKPADFVDSTECSWDLLVVTLWLGQIYE